MADITQSYSTQDVRAGKTGLGLRWVLGVSLVAVVVAFIAVTGMNIAA